MPQRSVRLCWSTDGVDAMNLARQRNLQQGRHWSQTLCNLPKRGAKGAGTPGGRPTPELSGDRPKKRRAPTLELDRPLVFFNTVGTCVFILDLSGYVSEVAHGSGTMFRGLVLVFRFPLEWFIAFLSFSTAPLLCPRLPATLAGGLSEDGPSAACLRSLSQEWSRRIAVRLRRPCRRVLWVP